MLRIKSLVILLFISLTCVFILYSYHSSSGKVVLNLKDVLEVAVSAAELGGDQVRKVKQTHQLKERSKGKTKEGVNDPLTEGDIKAHECMVYGLKKIFPEVKIISEEHDDKEINLDEIETPKPKTDIGNIIKNNVFVNIEDITIWVDPLDATKEYTEDLLQYVTTMICVAIKGKPVIGIIHQPFKQRTFWAWVDHGVSANLHVAPKQDKPVIIVSQSHAGKVKDVATTAFGKGTEVISAGGAGYKTLQIIQGNATAYVHVTLIKKWDICAGNALLNAVGGKMTTLAGEDLQYGLLDNIKNERGLLATIYNHEMYLEKLQAVKI